MSAEKELEKKFWSFGKALGARPELFLNTKHQLTMMKRHDEKTYYHEMRVALIAAKLAEISGKKDIKPEFFGGANHDMGKLLIDNKVLQAKNFSNKEYVEVKSHAKAGYYLQERFLFTALIAGFHHAFQENGYGISMQTLQKIKTSDENKARITNAAFLVALADFYDALLTRKSRLEKNRSAMEIMFDAYPGKKKTIKLLFENPEIKTIINPFASKLFE